MDSLLERAEKEKLSLSKQLEYKRFQLIAETDKLLQCERRLSESQATVSKLQAVNVRLQVKLQARDVQQGDKNQQSNDTVNATGARIEKIALKPPTKEAFSLKEHNISKRTEAKTSNNELKVNEGKFSTLPEKSDEVVIEKKRTRLVSFSPSSIDKEEEEEERGTIDEPQCAKPIPGGRKRGIQNQKRLVDAHAYQRENNAECNQQ
ncbi:PREDICTED: uncharacterized protein LOC106804974 [Priapulus caudatus]|uniref:Uncharacterized protein LOC106804974 n=1 Tax=Priapulus caudatus TaxID=37621 RepID=A0ABM1DPL3_PRICU|nr:PREDICTED: uncharacterized protein LOC106804974 [Priapulus caudatus]